jgi:protein SCO1/2
MRNGGFWRRSVLLTVSLAGFSANALLAHAEDPHAHHKLQRTDAVTRRDVELALPDVRLVDQRGAAFALQSLAQSDAPVVLNFIFATCTTVCPISSAGFADFQSRLDALGSDARLVSITIDPEHDTPSVLADYAARFGAGERWRFATGSRADIERTLRAFDAYVANKMSHTPKTFLRARGGKRWIRVDGFMNGAEHLAELERALTP